MSTSKKKHRQAQDLIREGIKELKLHSSADAKTAFKQVLLDFPDSKERIQALLLLARTHY
ncbi:uncharacterized protein METZ01_LOCUS394607, partial [marine metagenome]